MRRRELLAGLGSLGLLGTGGVAAYSGLDFGDSSQQIEPVALPRLNGSSGSVTVPARGQVTFVELFATWCTVCDRHMSQLTAAENAAPGNVQFISVTREPLGATVTSEDVVEWFTERGGDWLLAYDEDLTLSQRLDATNPPHSAVLDSQNRLVWDKTGYSTAETLIEQIENAQ